MWKERRIDSLPRWPDGVRLPIIISPHHQSEEMSSLYPDDQPDGFDFSERQYGGRRGAWRLLEIMEKHGVKGTWLICGATAEKYPEVSRAVKKAGNAIAGHTYEHEMMCNLPAAKELELMKKTVTVFEDLLGEHLRGWRTCFASHNTIDLILKHFDFEWDGSMWNDDCLTCSKGTAGSLSRFLSRLIATLLFARKGFSSILIAPGTAQLPIFSYVD